jgi:hypothetical protein
VDMDSRLAALRRTGMKGWKAPDGIVVPDR